MNARPDAWTCKAALNTGYEAADSTQHTKQEIIKDDPDDNMVLEFFLLTRNY